VAGSDRGSMNSPPVFRPHFPPRPATHLKPLIGPAMFFFGLKVFTPATRPRSPPLEERETLRMAACKRKSPDPIFVKIERRPPGGGIPRG